MKNNRISTKNLTASSSSVPVPIEMDTMFTKFIVQHHGLEEEVQVDDEGKIFTVQMRIDKEVIRTRRERNQVRTSN